MIVLLILLALPLSLGVQFQCPDYGSYLIKNNCAGCGVCQIDRITSSTLCFYNVVEYFYEGKYCNPVLYCKTKEISNQCKGHSCLSMLGAFRCNCDVKTYGRFCEYNKIEGSAFNDYAVLGDIIFTPIVFYSEYVVFTLIFINTGKSLEVEVETPYESHTYDSDMCQEVSKNEYCKKWFKDYPALCHSNDNIKKNILCALTLQFIFPSLSFSMYDDIHNINDDKSSGVLGGKYNVTVKIYNHVFHKRSSLVFANTYKVMSIFVGPNIHPCQPKVTVRNAGDSMREIFSFTTRDEIVITSSYKLNSHPECENVDNIMVHWSVWRILKNHNELTTKPIREVFEDVNLYFPPFSLERGFYKTKINISVWNNLRESFAYYYVYFKVVDLELLPVISGGEERTVYHGVKFLTLDGSLSRNPNVPPSKQEGSLNFHWRCDKPIDSYKKKYSEHTITYPGPFNVNETYTFHLTVTSTMNHGVATTSQRIQMSPHKQFSIEVLCKKNCGGSGYESNPNKLIYLEAVIVGDSVVNNTFEWTYTLAKEKNYKSVSGISQKNTPNNVLIILKNSLSAGETYSFDIQFQVAGKSTNQGGAKFSVKMADKVPSFSCDPGVNFESGTILRGVTKLKVVCDKLEYNKLAPIYDFYDRHVDDKDDSGRLIASGKSNIAFDVVLTRGKLVVEVTNEYGMTGVLELVANLQDTANVIEIVRQELENLKENGSTSDAEFRVNTISVILDLVTSETHNATEVTNILENVLKIASEDEISNIPILKTWTCLVNSIAKEDLIGNFTTKSVNYLSKAITKLSTKLLYEIRGGINETEINDLTDEAVHSLSSTLLKISNAICNSSNEDVIKKRLSEEDSYNFHASYRESSDFLVRAVGRIMLCLALTALPHESPIIMKESSINIWVKEDTPESFSVADNESLTSVVISETLARSMGVETIVVQVAEFVNNPYWYNREFDIHTHAVDLQVRFKTKNSLPFIREILHPVLINLQHFETETTVINGSVCQPYSNESPDLADQAVAIHQIRVPYTGRMNLKFLNLEENNVIRIKVLYNLRPDYEFMTSKHVALLTKSSPTLTVDLKDPHSHDLYDLYYIGILPGLDVAGGKCLNYSFELTALHCVTWKFHQWSTGGCTVKEVTNSQQLLQCECEHLSTFAGFSQVPINTIDPFADHKLFLGLSENPFVFIFIVVLLSVYFILLLWTLRKDCKDRLKGGAIYLEDNFPRDPFPYLVAVYTGNKLFSGTTSRVGIMIEGEDAASRPHLLHSSSHRVLETGDDNWFILFTPHFLGDLTMIHLWIDYSGKSPEWYCHKIIIFDLVTYKEYLFLVDSWMSLKGYDFIERFVEVSKSPDEHRFNAAVDNLILGFRETHLWLSVLARHPRSSVTRAQRLSLAFTGLLVTMLVSCMFYGVLEERKEDYPNFTFSIREFVVAVMSLVISSTLINIVVSLFRRSLVLKQYDEEYMLEVEEEDGDSVKKPKTKKKQKSKNKNLVRRLFENVLKILSKPKKFKPVLLNIEEINVKHKKKISDMCWSLFSWSICISMACLCSYLIVLYGLQFGKVKSLEWLTCVVFSFLQIIFLVAPFRIISLATVSGMLSSNMYEVVSYRIQPELLEKCKLWQLNSDPNLDSKLINIRSQRFYVPLSYKEVAKKFYKQKKTVATWLLLDMIFILVLAVLMFIQNKTLWTTKYYWNNQQLTSLLRKGYEEEGIMLYSLTNLSLFSLFLEKDVFPVIYRSKWYNDLPIMDGNAVDDHRFVFSGTSKLFGLPRLRQIRLKPDLCEKPIYENLSQYCNIKLTEETEDTNLYAEGWVETGPHEKFRKLSPWNYMNDSETYETTLFGYSNIAYKGDGYVAELDMTEEKSEDIVITLHREKWLDRRTCVVIFELTLYNGFCGTFSWLISVTENLHIGLLMNRVYVFTVSDSYNFPIVDIVFFVGLLMFSVRVFFVVNRNGVDKLIYNFWNIFEIMIVCLAVACAALFMLNIYSRSDYMKTVTTGDDREKYFQYFHLLEYLDEFRTVLLFLVICLVFRLVMSFKFGKRFTVYFDCMVVDWNRIVWLFIIISLFLYTHWRIFSYLMNNYTLSKNNFLIISKVDFKQIVANCTSVHCKVSPFVLCTVSCFVQLVITTHLVFTYRIVKRKLSEKEHLNFCSVFCEKHDFPIIIKEATRKSRVLKLS